MKKVYLNIRSCNKFEIRIKKKMKLVLGWVTNAMFECLSIFTKGTWGGGGGIEKPLGLYVVANIKNISIFSTSLRSWVQFCEYQPPFEIFFEYFPQVFIADHFYNNFISEIKLYSKYEYVCVCVCEYFDGCLAQCVSMRKCI